MSESTQQAVSESEDLYFISPIHRFIFALVELDGESKQRVLGITQELYNDKEKAKSWRDSIAKQIHPDCCKIEGADCAMAKLSELYTRMVSD